MAITLQRVDRSPSCLVLGGVFGDGGSNGAISGWIKSKMAAGGRLEKTSNGQISEMHYPIHCMFTDHTLPSDSIIYNDGNSKLIS